MTYRKPDHLLCSVSILRDPETGTLTAHYQSTSHGSGYIHGASTSDALHRVASIMAPHRTLEPGESVTDDDGGGDLEHDPSTGDTIV